MPSPRRWLASPLSPFCSSCGRVEIQVSIPVKAQRLRHGLPCRLTRNGWLAVQMAPRQVALDLQLIASDELRSIWGLIPAE